MGVNTEAMRRHAEIYERWEDAPLKAGKVLEIVDAIDSLRAQLAEARKQAIPWRDGPARGGEEIPEDRANILTLTDIGDQELFLQATWASLYGGKVSLYGGPSWGRVEKWCYQHDILPTEPTQ